MKNAYRSTLDDVGSVLTATVVIGLAVSQSAPYIWVIIPVALVILIVSLSRSVAAGSHGLTTHWRCRKHVIPWSAVRSIQHYELVEDDGEGGRRFRNSLDFDTVDGLVQIPYFSSSARYTRKVRSELEEQLRQYRELAP